MASVCCPHTAGGNSQRAPAIWEVRRWDVVYEAHSLARIVTWVLKRISEMWVLWEVRGRY